MGTGPGELVTGLSILLHTHNLLVKMIIRLTLVLSFGNFVIIKLKAKRIKFIKEVLL
jgi:hypothetical protein